MFPHVPVNYVISNPAGSKLSLLGSSRYGIRLTSSANKPDNQQVVNDSSVKEYLKVCLNTFILNAVIDCVLNTKLRKNGNFCCTL